MEFRKLRANEIECRIGTVKRDGVTLLLYKDARCDMNILDETIGQYDWQRDHKELKGNIYCGVGIRRHDTDEWVWKWDAGAESYTESIKGEASDSFKRACFNWGIGRELYTAPFIWITDCKIEQDDKGRYKCWDRFDVSEIEYDSNKISYLVIKKKGKVVFSWGNPQKFQEWISLDERDKSIKLLKDICEKKGKKFDDLLTYLRLDDEKQLTKKQYAEWSMKLTKED